MRSRAIVLSALMLGFIVLSSCKKEELFEQPSVEITGISLKEMPGEFTELEVTMLVTNSDSRDANIADLSYTVDIEGVTSELEELELGEELLSGTPLEITLPLTLRTENAIELLSFLDSGESLEYAAIGEFHVDDPILKLFSLPLDVHGYADVQIGFSSFFDQPHLTVNSLSGDYTNEGGSYQFDFDVECSIVNMDTRSAVIDEVEYVVTIEGITSEKQTYSTPVNMPGNASFSLELPVSLVLDETNGATLAAAMEDESIDFKVEALCHTIEVDGTTADFELPLFFTGAVTTDFLSDLFVQPTIEVSSMSLAELPGDSAHLTLDLLVTNNDTREALIHDVVYQVDIEGVQSATENMDINETLLVATPLEITVPLTLATAEAIKLLDKLDAGESLSYEVTGFFHVDDPVLEFFDLPIDIQGTALVDVGLDDFYKQPEITATEITGDYTINGITSYTFDLDVDCDVENIDARDVIIDEVEYVVYIEGVKSETHYFTDAYVNDLSIGGVSTVSLELPVELNLGIAGGVSLLTALGDGSADYVIEGTFHAISVDGSEADFMLPLYDEGSAPVSLITK